jgi:predicted CopG family antitoxin
MSYVTRMSTKTYLKSIAVSERNYQTLKNLGRAGDSLNDVVTDLIKKMGAKEMLGTTNEKDYSLTRAFDKQSQAVETLQNQFLEEYF